MKQVILSFSILISSIVFGQQTFETISFEGETREYYKYLPTGFDQANEELPLVIFLHGLGGNALQLTGAGYNLIADTARFIPVYLEGTLNSFGQNAWNNGTLLSSEANDVLFISRIIDTMRAEHNIDLSRVYMSGISMGSIMTYKAIRHLDNRIAAVSCHIGTMSTEEIAGYNPSFPIPVQHIHGTDDATVPYNSNPLPSLSLVPETIDKLKTINGWSGDSTIVNIPDTKPDGITIEKIQYDCTTPLELWKLNGGDHIYLSTVNDTVGTFVSWYWFRQFSHPNPITVSVENENQINSIELYPNPATDNLFIKGYYNVSKINFTNVNGQIMKSIEFPDETISISDLPNGIYFIDIFDINQSKSTQKIIIN